MRGRFLVVIAVLVVLAGCGSSPGDPSTVGTERGTLSPEPTAATATAADVATPTTAAAPARTPTSASTTAARTATRTSTMGPPSTATPSPTATSPSTAADPSAPPRSPTAEDASTAANGSGIVVENGSLPVDPDRVFDRVASVLGTDVAPPSSVIVREDPENFSAGFGSASVPDFWSLVGVTRSEPRGSVSVVENGYTTALGEIVLYPGAEPNATSVSWLLAHEFVHYVQAREGRVGDLRRALGATSTDDQFVQRAVLEGSAATATDAYIDRHLPDSRSNSALYRAIAAAYPAGSYQRYANAQYVEGVEYVRERVDDPAATDQLYATPPRTSEQVIHGLSPGVEPAKPLAVTLRANGSEFAPVGRDTMGEAFVRTVLANGVNESRAAAAAAGWGADRRVIARTDDGGAGHAWALRWDDAANASEFVAAFRAYRDGDATGADTAIRLTRVSDETVVVLVGDPRFVDAATANGTNDRVTVIINTQNSS